MHMSLYWYNLVSGRLSGWCSSSAGSAATAGQHTCSGGLTGCPLSILRYVHYQRMLSRSYWLPSLP